MTSRRRILLLASAVAPFGTGPTGGVSRYAAALCRAIEHWGASPCLVVPEGSPAERLPAGVETTQLPGTCQPSGTDAERRAWPAVGDNVLGNMLRLAADECGHGHADLAINLNHDWLPYWLTPLFPGRLLHIANLTDSDAATTAEIAAQHHRQPGTVACLGETHRTILGLKNAPIVPCGLELDDWPDGQGEGGYVAFCGRLAPEKGVLEAARAAALAARPLRIAGAADDPEWWRAAWPEVEAAGAEQVGFLNDAPLAAFLGQAECLVMAQRWQEAFGIVMAEAMLCGTPVAAVPRGANLELVEDGVTGAIAEEATPEAVAAAIATAVKLDRTRVRKAAVGRFSIAAMTRALTAWLSGGQG